MTVNGSRAARPHDDGRCAAVTTRPRTGLAFARQFKNDEEGSFTVFGLFIFIAILLIGGLAVDIMRLEAKRTRMQNTIDTAVLAAADLEQALDSEAVAISFIEAAGYAPGDVQFEIIPETLNNGMLVGRQIRARSTVEMETLFMHMVGIENLRSPTRSAAIENVQNVEISLVLDISGSMRWDKSNKTANDNRITDLKNAVKDFIDVVMQVECDANGMNCVQSPASASTTINIIPYAGHVNPGPELFAALGGQRWHDWSSCKEVTNTDFADADLPDASGDQLPHFMKWTIDNTWMNWGWCPKDNAAILVAENDAQAMKDYIDGLSLHDGTATHVGLKYGLALLNPSSRDEFATLAANGVINGAYSGRPFDFEDDVVKYVVLMTDGKITDQHRPSDFDYNAVFDESNPAHDRYMNRFGSVDANGNVNPAATVEKGYPPTKKYSEGGYIHDYDRNATNFKEMCRLAKLPVYETDNGGAIKTDANGNPIVAKQDRVTVFTIAFLAPDEAQTQMRGCASTPSHFFNVKDLTISNAFSAIAKTINQLRLTQ